MVRLFHAYFPLRTLLLAVSEVILAALAMLVSMWARFGADSQLVLFYESGLLKVALVVVVCILCMYYYDLYDSQFLITVREVSTRLLNVLGTTCLILAVVYALYPSLRLSLSVFLLGIALVGVSFLLWRRLFCLLTNNTHLTERVLLVGYGPLASSLASEIRRRPELALRVVGVVGTLPDHAEQNGLTHLGKLEELQGVVDRTHPSRVFITMNDRRGILPLNDLLLAKTRGIRVEDGSRVYEMVTGKVPLESLRISWLLFSSGFPASPGLLLYKRIWSAILAGTMIVLSSPLMLLVALAIWLSSGNPVLFRQKRVGKDGRIFTLYKFRTMRVDAEAESGPTWATDDDPRITRLGRFLRRTRLDEIPQLWNVLLGTMSFVGPRPERPEFVEWLNRELQYYHLRHVVRPGVTGWAQVRYKYGNTLEDVKEKLQYDLFYIKNLSMGLDFLIFFETIKTILLRRGAQ